MTVGLFRHLLHQRIVVLELVRELVHYLGHAVQILKEDLGFVLAFGLVQTLA